ncbi:DUF2513 domain-containing protein [Sandarakinorhabdus sp.]|uniref:DUF2513 domain-containing protein n=1 Tax=Sandarakinorhabdus sp. TaxID=1916663 RepID=UPI00334168EC
MKRDMELIRKILFHIEACERPNGPDQIDLPEESPDAVSYHVSLLLEANLIQGMVQPDPNSVYGCWIYHPSLTWNGHEFLDNVRDDAVWKKTKEGASKVGGWSISLVGDIAKAVLKVEAKRRLGLDIGD